MRRSQPCPAIVIVIVSSSCARNGPDFCCGQSRSFKFPFTLFNAPFVREGGEQNLGLIENQSNCARAESFFAAAALLVPPPGIRWSENKGRCYRWAGRGFVGQCFEQNRMERICHRETELASPIFFICIPCGAAVASVRG